MKEYKTWLVAVMAAMGLLLMALSWGQSGSNSPWPYLCIGIGAGLFGQGTGELVSRRALRDCPEFRRQLEIVQKDERNIAIASRAKGKAYDMMTYAFGALIVSFAVMRVQMAVVWMLVLVYLFVHGYALYWRCRYEKEM